VGDFWVSGCGTTAFIVRTAKRGGPGIGKFLSWRPLSHPALTGIGIDLSLYPIVHSSI
jgi:hypothetical protein